MRAWRSMLIAAAILAVVGPAHAADKVNMTFSFGKAGKDAGVYVALEKGYFAAADIDLTVTAGRGSGVSIANVEAGNSQFAAADFGSIVTARAKGGTIKSVMLLYDLSPFAVASLKERLELKSVKSFEGRSVSAPQGSAIRVQLPVLFRLNGVDASKVRLVHMPGSAFIQTLFRGEVDISSAFINEVGVAMQIEAAKAGKELTWLRFRDFGLDLYAMTVITSDRIIAQNPGLVRRMIGALVKGYAFMVANPDEAAQIILKHTPELPADVTRGQVKETVTLAQTPRFQERGYGWADEKKLRHTVDVLAEAMEIKNKPALGDVHTNEFLPAR